MNKPVSKKSKVKCPSTKFAPDNVKDELILNEHINGVVNGLSPDKKYKTTTKEKLKSVTQDSRQIIDEKPVNGVVRNPLDSNNIKHTKKKKTKLKNDCIEETQIVVDKEPSDNESNDVKIIDNEKSSFYDALASCSSIETSLPPLTSANCGTKEILDVVESLVCMQIKDKSIAVHVDNESDESVKFMQYESEIQMPMIMKIIQKDLSEPYSIYTYRYFIHNWPKLCYLAMCDNKCVGAIVCKLDTHRKVIKRGYIAMLAVDKDYRKKRMGSKLVELAIEEMIRGDADEVVLETEVTNKPALQLYEKLGFVRDKRLFRYYLNGVDALRLKLWLR